jgi:dephospho-CoA kinase
VVLLLVLLAGSEDGQEHCPNQNRKENMLKVGITGGIGSGKTTVAKLFEAMGVPVYNADIEAKKIMSSDAKVKSLIKNLLGDAAYYRNGKPNRPYIASKIFGNKELLAAINSIVHPAVHTDTEAWANHYLKEGKTAYILKEAALLVENGSYKNLDKLIVVTCPESDRIIRVMKRDKLRKEDVIKKIQNQLPESEKIKVADYIIMNDGHHPLIPQVWKIHQELIKI